MPRREGLTVDEVERIICNLADVHSVERATDDIGRKYAEAAGNTCYFILSSMGYDHQEIVAKLKPKSAR